MRKVKKLSLVLVIMLIIVACRVNYVYAALSAKGNLSLSKTDVTAGEEFNVTFNISDVQGDKGIVALSGTVKYDKNVLELVKKSGSNTWGNPSLNEENGIFATDREDLGKENESVFTLTFKVKEGAKGSTIVSIEDITMSDADVEEKIENVSKTITIKEKANNNDDDDDKITNIPTTTTKPDNKNNSNNKSQTTTLPKTGEGHFVLISGSCALGAVIIAVIFYRKLKNS